MYMIRHDLHFKNGSAEGLSNFRQDLLQAGVNSVNKDFTPVFRTKDDMVLAAVNNMFAVVIRPCGGILLE